MLFRSISSESSSSHSVDQSCVISKPIRHCSISKKRGKKYPKLIVNVGCTQYNVVREVAQQIFNYRLCLSSNSEWDLMWADTGVNTELVSRMRLYQKINHFPTMWCLARKNNLAKNLMRMRKIFPRDFNFFPPTWTLPAEGADFRTQISQSRSKTYIVKPEAMSQGKGIYLIRSPDEIEVGEHCVVQRYIKEPYLIDGLKFDLRIYVLVYGCDPLRIYIYKEGLARLATEKYETPTKDNMENMYMHLTNYAINKDSKNFVFNTDADNADTGNKRSLKFIWSYIDRHGGNSGNLRKLIKRSIVKTICAVQPQLAHPYRTCQPNDIGNNMCFEILGFDILLDKELKPWLLEVNHSPSFTTDTPFDHKVKQELIYDTIRLLHMDPDNRIKYYRKKEQDFNSKALGRMNKKATKEERKELRRQAMMDRDEYELRNLGGYTRIYPDLDMNDEYEKFISAAEDAWQEFYGYKKKSTYKYGMSNAISKTSSKTLKNTRYESRKPYSKGCSRIRGSSKDPQSHCLLKHRENSSSIIHAEDYEPNQEEPKPNIKNINSKQINRKKANNKNINNMVEEDINKRIDENLRQCIETEISLKNDEITIKSPKTKSEINNIRKDDSRINRHIRKIKMLNILEDPAFGIYRSGIPTNNDEEEHIKPVEFPSEAKKNFLYSY